MENMKAIIGDKEFIIRNCTRSATKDLRGNAIETVSINFLDKSLSLKDLLSKISNVKNIIIVNELGERMEFNIKKILNVFQELSNTETDYPTITINIY